MHSRSMAAGGKPLILPQLRTDIGRMPDVMSVMEQGCSTRVSFRFFAAVVCLERDREVVGKLLVAKTISPPLNGTCPEREHVVERFWVASRPKSRTSVEFC